MILKPENLVELLQQVSVVRNADKLSILMEKKLNVLILDEPTNHLDIESQEILENSLMQFQGTIICVSHDRNLLEKFNKIFWLENQNVTIFSGPYSFFKELQNRLTRISDVALLINVAYFKIFSHFNGAVRQFSFPDDAADQRCFAVSVLSGGERIRLKLSILMEKKLNVLILDEPTNHLDIESQEILENSLMQFQGIQVVGRLIQDQDIQLFFH